jgi:chromate transport protein ChrA
VAAATSMSTIAGPGVAALKFGLGTDVTGATKLLWEVGAVGLVAYVAPLFLAFLGFGRVLRDDDLDPLLRSFVQALRASTPVLALAVLYEVTIVSSPPLQLIAMILYAVAARLEARRPVRAPRTAVRLASA